MLSSIPFPIWLIACLSFCCSALLPSLHAAVHRVKNAEELKSVLTQLQKGDEVHLEPGDYPGGWTVKNISNLTLRGTDPKRPPHFIGGNVGMHVSQCSHLTLQDLRFTGQKFVGLNVDDGGTLDLSTQHVTLQRIQVSEIGPVGNHDGIKASGIKHLKISECSLRAWGGQGIDLVGCHEVHIEKCRFQGEDGYSASAGIQAKGGSESILIENCTFHQAGLRALNLGGSTGLPFFRPQGAPHEAKNITVRHNHIEGSDCAAAFVGLDGGVFEENSIENPKRWVFRILQETRESRFVRCRNVVIQNNVIVYQTRDFKQEINIGDETKANSFVIQGNHWLSTPLKREISLPGKHVGSTFGTAVPAELKPILQLKTTLKQDLQTTR